MSSSTSQRSTQALHHDALSREAAARGFSKLAVRHSQRFRVAVLDAVSSTSDEKEKSGTIPSRRRPLWGDAEDKNHATSSSVRLEDLLPRYYVEHNSRCVSCALPLLPGLTAQRRQLRNGTTYCSSCKAPVEHSRPSDEAKLQFSRTNRRKRSSKEEHLSSRAHRHRGSGEQRPSADGGAIEHGEVHFNADDTMEKDGKIEPSQDLSTMTLEQRAAMLRKKKREKREIPAEGAEHEMDKDDMALPAEKETGGEITLEGKEDRQRDEGSRGSVNDRAKSQSISSKTSEEKPPKTLDGKSSKPPKKGAKANDKSAALRALLQKDRDKRKNEKDKREQPGGASNGAGGLMDFLGSL